MDAIQNLKVEELIERGIRLNAQIAELQKQLDKVEEVINCKYPCNHTTEILRAGAYTCKRVVTHKFRFKAEGIPTLKRIYGNQAEQFLSTPEFVPTARFRDILTRADDRDNLELRRYLTTDSTIKFTFGMEL